ncbi:MAG: glycine--tRNA ligase [Spirochaetales bacterium]|nr:glycine--tRNA ligase [Spirochaetales bacterium]
MAQKKAKNIAEPLKDLVALCKRRGFIFPGSDIYGGLTATFDYGPYGTELLRNIKNEWWKTFVHQREDVVGLDSSIMLHPDVWKASGHIASFNDPLMDCKQCKSRFRADSYFEERGMGEGLDLAATVELHNKHQTELACPDCGTRGQLTAPRQFNLMFKTRMGATAERDIEVFLRPETAQGIFINFRNVTDSCRVKIPFGIAQIGKSFRNEIIARQFVFRTREFEQMELEYFCQPGTQEQHFSHWLDYCMQWLKDMGLRTENLRIRHHEKEELSHYSDATADIEYQYPFGWGELWGIASRTNFDLNAHQSLSGKNLDYFDAEKNERYLPYVVEPALGVNRLLLAILSDAYVVENPGAEQRTVLKLHPRLAPVKAAIFPLQKKDGLGEIARKLYLELADFFPVDFDQTGSIGKRYYRQDELGTPYCITIDYETRDDETVTVRDRNTTEQQRMPLSAVKHFLLEKIFSRDTGISL